MTLHKSFKLQNNKKDQITNVVLCIKFVKHNKMTKTCEAEIQLALLFSQKIKFEVI